MSKSALVVRGGYIKEGNLIGVLATNSVLELLVRINTILANSVFIMKERSWDELHTTRILLKVCFGGR